MRLAAESRSFSIVSAFAFNISAVLWDVSTLEFSMSVFASSSAYFLESASSCSAFSSAVLTMSLALAWASEIMRSASASIFLSSIQTLSILPQFKNASRWL
jgi:hypothetical protein